MVYTKAIVFILILLAMAVRNGHTTTASAPTSFLLGTVITFSGRNDPSFDVTDSNDIQTIQQMLTNLIPTSQPDWPQFGFRGYGLKNEGVASFPAYLRVFQGVIQIFDSAGSSFYQDNNGLQNFLSQKANSTPSNSPNVVRKRDAPAAPKTLPTTGCEPAYDPNLWNKADVIEKNNCYNYATNNMANNFAQPGDAAGKPAAKFACADYVAAAQADGLTKANCDNACPKGSYKVALVIWPDEDFHWYRQDDNGNWSHKPGETEATNLDNSKNPIVDPRTADRGSYTSFCECFCVGTCAKGD